MDDASTSGLGGAAPAELYSARTSITIVSRVAALTGEMPPEVSGWLAGLAAAIDAEIDRR